ncbi:hypothetical protein ACOMHN_002155 [Nucella lapillus]
MAAPEARTATLLHPIDSSAPDLRRVHLLPPSSTTTSPPPVPVFVPSLSPTTDPCGDSRLQPAIFSPTAAAIPGIAQPVWCSSGPKVKVKDMDSLLEELSLPTEEALFTFVQDGLESTLRSVQDSLQERSPEDVRKKITLMSERWAAGRLSPAVRSHLGSLAAALREEKLEEAHELRLSLMKDHSTEVREWLAGIQQILEGLHSKDSRSLLRQQETQGQCLTNATTPTGAVESSAPSSNVISEPQSQLSQLVSQTTRSENNHSSAEERR